MAVICGVVGAGIAHDRTDILAGVLAVFEPHGTNTSVRTLDVGRRTAVLAARRFDDEQPNLAVEPGFDRVDGDRSGVTVVGDIRLDHRQELADRVGVATSCSDTELVAAAYLRWGDQCIGHLYGDFAIAIADPHRGGVLLARDHAGHRSLVIHERPGQVAFATTALALTGLDGVEYRIDTERVAQVLALGFSTDRTMVDGVRFVEAGTAIWIDDDGTRRWRWWDPDPNEIDDLGSIEAHADALRASFDAAVASQLRTSRSPAIMLSGGLDSTAVAATAAPMVAPDKLRTYTSVPSADFEGHPRDHKDPDERHLVEALARRWPNLSPRFLDVRGRDPFEHHEALWELGSGPTRNAMNVMWVYAINEEAAADGVSAMLTGAFGNAAFSAGGPRWLVELARHGHLLRAAREVKAWSSQHDRTMWSVARSDLLAPLTPDTIRRRRRRNSGRPDRTEAWLASSAIRDDRAGELDLTSIVPTMQDADPTRWTRQPTVMLAGVAAQAETRAATLAWWGLETRDPTAERKLLELALRQPDWWRRHRGVDRAVVRTAMADRLPPEIVDRTRRGAQLPDWFDRLTDARLEVEQELEELRDHPTSRDLIDVGRLDALVQNWPQRKDAFDADATRGYRLALPRALMVSRYVRWFENRGRRVASGGPTVVVPPR